MKYISFKIKTLISNLVHTVFMEQPSPGTHSQTIGKANNVLESIRPKGRYMIAKIGKDYICHDLK
jgi:hypothetical protein